MAGKGQGHKVTRNDKGTPQGGVISPLLANIYLHYVLDAWLEEAVKPRIGGRVFLIRYADDFVILCRNPEQAVVREAGLWHPPLLKLKT